MQGRAAGKGVHPAYSPDASRGFPLKEKSLDAFDFLVVVFLNIGRFVGARDGSEGSKPVEFYTLPASFIRDHHDATSSWEKVELAGKDALIAPYRDEDGFEHIARALGVPRPGRPPS